MRVSSLTLLFITLFPFIFCAQISEEFTDGDFTNNPTWNGDVADFAVIDEILQLNATAAGNSSLSTAVNIADSTFWEFLVELDFNPSASGNFPKIYLSSDNADLEADLNGYYLRIGETGALDAFEVYRQNGNTDEFLFRFNTEGAMSASSNNKARVRISRNDAGSWNCFADYEGGICFAFEGSFTENSIPSGTHFGISYQFTSSNTSNFFIDDIFVDAVPSYDNNMLSLSSINALDATDLVLTFNLPLDLASAEMANNYTVKDGTGASIGSPTSATIDATNSNVVHVDVSNLPIDSGEEYTICATDVLDCSGSPIGIDNSGTFAIFITEAALPGDIIINELFADPEPGLGFLPEAEFIELYNRSDKAIDINNFQIGDPTTISTLGPKIMPPLSYLIICEDEFANEFMPFGDVLAATSLAGLNNAGDVITFADETGMPLDQVTYSSDWYQDEDKQAGGWTLELINPSIYCQEASNWIASQSANGGTPGQQNSFFDNTPDVTSPKLIGATAINNQQVRLVFNEIMTSTPSFLDFELSSGVGAIVDIVLEEPDKNSFLVTIGAPFFQDQTTYNILLENEITDCVGNPIDVDFNNLDFEYAEAEIAEPYDILINEIYADPTPSIGLPEAEYLELFNRSNKVINLEGFTLSDRNADIVLPFYLIFPGDYLILYLEGEGAFGIFGDVLPLEDFVGLGNTDDDLDLRNADDIVIHSVHYNSSWYQDASKSDGGWSLELVNSNAPCTFESNWRASVNSFGGTPGIINSIAENTLDDSPLDLIRAYPISNNQVQLFFNKSLKVDFASDINNYEIDGLTISNAYAEVTLYNTAVVEVTSPFDPETIYQIRVLSGLTDCIGNSPGMFMEASFAIPKEMEPLDVVINEILVNPEVGGVDFVELYNRSDKVVDIANLNVATRDEEDLLDNVIAIDIPYLLSPDEYLVLTKDPIDIRNRYITENPYNFLPITLPTLDDKEGVISIFLPAILGENVIDELAYDDSFQYALLSDENGVSLERINPNEATQTSDNWHSAAEQVGYATPTYRNSQFLLTDSNADDFVWVDNPRLSPDEDGLEDFLLINYALPNPGYAANINLFDSKGRLVRDLAKNSLLANEGTIKWDGVTNEGNDARPGIYVLYVNLLNPNGDTLTFKKAIVVATQLN